MHIRPVIAQVNTVLLFDGAEMSVVAFIAQTPIFIPRAISPHSRGIFRHDRFLLSRDHKRLARLITSFVFARKKLALEVLLLIDWHTKSFNYFR